MNRIPRLALSTFLWACALALHSPATAATTYRIERIASGLNQPTFVTQAPGDPANILYFTERTKDANPGFSATNAMGTVYRYDVNTRTKTAVLDLSARSVTQDAGLQTIAFSPDFNTVGSAGYQKFYVASAQNNGTPPPTSRVEEYTIGAGGTATLSRTILQYEGVGSADNHTVNWIGFDPTASGAARNYLHISTGDGNAGGTVRPSQNPADIHGKLLRVDVSGGDDYGGDANKNFAVPLSNPIPAYNAAHPGAPISGLGEVFVTGVRNGYRASFDTATGDLYVGDVGETTREELDFLRAGANAAGPPADFGWPQREGTANGWTSPFATTNSFTGATSLNPIREITREGGGNAIIGGYVYHGPVAELAGKYFYGDFVKDRVFQLDFNRDTDPATFNGGNGTLTDLTALWNSLVVDPNDPTYVPAIGSLFGIDHVVSFGQDNAGNLYIVDMGFGTGFQGQYPGPGLGEIFRVTPVVPEPTSAAAATALIIPLAAVLPRRRSRR